MRMISTATRISSRAKDHIPAAHATTQLPDEPVPSSSLMGAREVSSLQTTQLPDEPVPSSSLVGGTATSSIWRGTVVVKASIAVRGEGEEWVVRWGGSARNWMFVHFGLPFYMLQG